MLSGFGVFASHPKLNPFQSLSGNSSVVGCRYGLRFFISGLMFQSLSGNSSVVGRLRRCGRHRRKGSFNPFQGIQVLSVIHMDRILECISTAFQSLSGNSSVVGTLSRCASSKIKTCFNPFQGIQVLSVIENTVQTTMTTMFQSLSGNSSVVGHRIQQHQPIGFQFQSLSGNSSVVGDQQGKQISLASEFQSLSGNSSVVGNLLLPNFLLLICFNPFQGIQVLSEQYPMHLRQTLSRVSIPFREFKCCRFRTLRTDSLEYFCFNPFQGIQVLSDANHLPQLPHILRFQSLSGNSSVVGSSTSVMNSSMSLSLVSIPFREFKCCRICACVSAHAPASGFNPFQGIQVLSGHGRRYSGKKLTGFNPFQGIQVLSGGTSTDWTWHQLEFQSLSGNSSVVG